MSTIADIAAALLASGYHTLDEQARALGLKRSTTWTLMRCKHKVDRLHRGTIDTMLLNPELPTPVRQVLLNYVEQRSRVKR